MGAHVVAVDGKGPCVRLWLWVAGHKRAKLIAGETGTKDIKPIEVLARAPISITCERHRNRVRRPFGLGLSQIVLLPLRTQLLQLLEIDIIPVRPTRRVDKQLTLGGNHLRLGLVVKIVEDAMAGSKRQNDQAGGGDGNCFLQKAEGHHLLRYFFPLTMTTPLV